MPKEEDRRAFTFQWFGEEIQVFSVPSGQQGGSRLSPAEGEVLRLLLRGYRNKEIAQVRKVSPRTVANQVASIFRKLGVQSRSELAAKLKNSLVEK
jgi:DNA-binding CsgD family transcriptional regulator